MLDRRVDNPGQNGLATGLGSMNATNLLYAWPAFLRGQ